MKVKNTSKRVMKLLNGKEKVTLIPGTNEVYEVSDSDVVQFYLENGDLTEAVVRSKGKAGKSEGKSKEKSEDDKQADAKPEKTKDK